MRGFCLAAAFALVGSQAGAVAVGMASGSVEIVLSSGSASLSVRYIADPFADPLAEITAGDGVVTFNQQTALPSVADPALPFLMGESVSVTADGAPPPPSGRAAGFVDTELSAVIEIFNAGPDTASFDLAITYALSASASVDRPADEFASGDAFLSVLFFDPLGGSEELTPDALATAFSDEPPFAGSALVGGSAPIRLENIILAGGEAATLDILMTLYAEADSDGIGAPPIPVPPTLALLPAGLGLLAMLRRRKRDTPA